MAASSINTSVRAAHVTGQFGPIPEPTDLVFTSHVFLFYFLPLTLAILPVLLVRVAHEIYALQLRCIEQTACFIPGDAHRVEDQEVIWMGTEPLPLLRLHDLFSVLSLPAEGQKLVVLGAAEKRVALLVDGLVGQESTVVTPLTPYLSHCAGIAGTTVDGDGRVRLVLDPAGLVAAAPSRQAAAR